VIAGGIETLVARRLGRAFVPLGLLFTVGALELAFAQSPILGLLTAGGAVLTAMEMLGYGLRITRRTLGEPTDLWMDLVLIASVLPLLFATWVVAWRGLRGMARSGFAPGLALPVVMTLVGAWVLGSWMKLVEVERLAQVMVVHTSDDRETPE
jgi:hypothetical protein